MTTTDQLIIRSADLESLLTALTTSRFLIVSGLSGTGKTQLVRRLSAALSERGVGWTLDALQACRTAGSGGPLGDVSLFSRVPDRPDFVAVADLQAIQGDGDRRLHQRRVAFQPVRPDWNDAKRIWGYYNPLSGRFHPTDALVVLLNAYRDFLGRGHDAARYFLVLDEMNLARVEYYLSDVLSLMETCCELDKRDSTRVHMGELCRIHPLENCVTSLGFRGVVVPVPPRPGVAGSEGEPSIPGRKGSIPSAAPRPAFDQQIVPLWELEADQWYYEPLIRAKRTVEREAVAVDPDKPGGRPTPLQQLYPIPPRIAFPPNLVVVGTVNVDETTHGFAPKVLDRAFVLELDRVDYSAVFAEDPRYPALAPLLETVHAVLEPWELQIGYRVVKEMLNHLEAAAQRDRRAVEDELLRAKILTRLTGSEDRLMTPIRELLALCLGGPGAEAAIPSVADLSRARVVADLLPEGQPPHYPLSAGKLLIMARRLLETGFCSFF